MTHRLSLWGIGPRMMLAAAVYALLAGIATWLWPEVCFIRTVPYTVFLVAGGVLLLIGVPMVVIAARAATVAYSGDELATTGIFGLVRHPIYSAWIVFLLPGLTLLTGSWPLFPTPLVAYAAFKMMIGKEDRYLEDRFGRAYLDYRAQVRELLPLPKFRAR